MKHHNLTEELRLLGGNPITVDLAPYVVVIHGEKSGSMCTGSLIALDVVLTLARCFYIGHELKESPSSLQVMAGVDSLINLTAHNRAQKADVSTLQIHPNFRPTSTDQSFGYNDIAVVILKERFHHTGTVQAITLGYLDWDHEHSSNCLLAFYGAVNPLTPTIEDDHLKLTEVVASRPCLCEDSLSTHFGSRVHRWLCYKPSEGGPVPCIGAGGAGLVCGGKLTALIVGLIPFEKLSDCAYRQSSKVHCNNQNSLTVFLELCPFMPWLRFNYQDLPQGPINCSKASHLNFAPYVLLVLFMVIQFTKNK